MIWHGTRSNIPEDPMADWLPSGPPLPGVMTPEALHEVLSRPVEQILQNLEFAATFQQALTITSQTEYEVALTSPMKAWNRARICALTSSDAVPCLLIVRPTPDFESSRKMTRRAIDLAGAAAARALDGAVYPSAEIVLDRGTAIHALEIQVIPLQTVSTAFTAHVTVDFSLIIRSQPPC